MAHREAAKLKAIVGAMLASLCFFGLTGNANAPAIGSAAALAAIPAPAVAPPPVDPMNTASLGNLLDSASFIGPNRALKQDRARPEAEVADFSGQFEALRARIASLRASMGKTPAPDAPAEPATATAEATLAPVAAAKTAEVAAAAPGPDTPAAPAGEVKVAAVDPQVASDALDAIDSVAAPLPQTMSTKLAYARADLPATKFDGTLTDKYGHKVTAKDLQCMAEAIYFEARGESYRGQIAVGQVVMNRVAHHLYPDDICAVVYQNQTQRNACQFSFACDGIPEVVNDQKAWAQAKDIAKGVIVGNLYVTEVGNATHYHAAYVYPAWAPHMTKVTRIGLHIFYQFRRGWKFG